MWGPDRDPANQGSPSTKVRWEPNTAGMVCHIRGTPRSRVSARCSTACDGRPGRRPVVGSPASGRDPHRRRPRLAVPGRRPRTRRPPRPADRPEHRPTRRPAPAGAMAATGRLPPRSAPPHPRSTRAEHPLGSTPRPHASRGPWHCSWWRREVRTGIRSGPGRPRRRARSAARAVSRGPSATQWPWAVSRWYPSRSRKPAVRGPRRHCIGPSTSSTPASTSAHFASTSSGPTVRTRRTPASRGTAVAGAKVLRRASSAAN